EKRGEQLIAREDAGLVLVHFLELRPLRIERHAVALEVDVNALRAVGRALPRRLAAVAVRPAALDAGTGEARLAALQEDERSTDEGQDSRDGDRVARAEQRIEPGVV